jgi:hypothetical protein
MKASHLTETGSGLIPNTRLWHEGYGFQSHHTALMKTLISAKIVDPSKVHNIVTTDIVMNESQYASN